MKSVTDHSNRNGTNHTSSTATYGYVWSQGAVQQSIRPTQTGSPAGNTWLTYAHESGLAVLQGASISDGRARTVFYAANLMGEVVRRRPPLRPGPQQPERRCAGTSTPGFVRLGSILRIDPSG